MLVRLSMKGFFMRTPVLLSILLIAIWISFWTGYAVQSSAILELEYLATVENALSNMEILKVGNLSKRDKAEAQLKEIARKRIDIDMAHLKELASMIEKQRKFYYLRQLASSIYETPYFAYKRKELKDSYPAPTVLDIENRFLSIQELKPKKP